MGMTPRPQAGKPERAEDRRARATPPAAAATESPPQQGEDDIFRDPFSDFAPSGR